VPGAPWRRAPVLIARVTLLDEVLPRWDAREFHSTASTRSLEQVLATPVAADPIVKVLFRMRGIRTAGTIGELAGGRFDVLARDADEVVLGASGTPWRPTRGLEPFAAARAGTVQVAVSFRVDGAVVSTETRILAADPAARRAFRRYWRVVGPFSALVRRRWLRLMA
jgi:hypothetical protein